MVDQIILPKPVQPTGPVRQQQQNRQSAPISESPFSQLFEQKLTGAQAVKFSQHAQERLRARNISFSPADLANLEGAVNSVASKGGRESLVMMGDAALVVSVTNRTVVTALDRTQMKGNVFTNIDSAVII